MRKQPRLQPGVGRIAESRLVKIPPPGVEEAVQGTDHFCASTHLNQHDLIVIEHRLDQSTVKAGKLRRREYSVPASIMPGDLVKIGHPREDLRSFLTCASDKES